MTNTLPVSITQLNEDTCWNAVQQRDASYSGEFVYAVRSTGIYCKPGCSSRLPRRDQVNFYRTPAEAETAGYRACQRCQPKEDMDSANLLVDQARQILDDSPDNAPSLTALSSQLHVSPSHLHRLFKKVLGITPHQYVTQKRMEQFKNHVHAGESVTQATYAAGFSSSSRLYERASEHLGMTPAVYKKGGQGETIAYTSVPTSLGKLMIAATKRGVCGVAFCEGESQCKAFLSTEYPSATIERDDQSLKDWAKAVVRHLEGEQRQLDLPLDVQATAFQMRVWQELRRIPYGETRTYSEIAQAIGQPKAIRAVGHACATNPTAIVIPCHRVIRTDHTLGGYRWGLDRKQVLLQREQQHAAENQGDTA